jgi:5'-3' exoribonuclease 1
MGVPGFFASLIKKYDIVIPYILDNYIECNELYFDTNCLIHPVCMDVYKNSSNLNNNDLEDKMIKGVIEYIEKIINLVNPKELVYLAIDGVAPMAKMKHQRIRRYKSIKEQEIKENIAKKHRVPYTKPWNNSAITPGTQFMRKLTKAIIKHIKSKETNIKYIFSSCNTPGEGEHKILQYIKVNDNNKNRIIYGLDADLIYLALASMKDNIYLLREKSHFNDNSNHEFNLVNIDIMKKCICEELNYDYKLSQQAIYDYIFLGFLLGNDFIPSLPSVNLLNMSKSLNGLEILMYYYSQIYEEKKEPLVSYKNNKVTINQAFLLELFKNLADSEEEYFKKSSYKKKYMNCQSNKPYDIEIFRLENLIFKIDDPIELGKIDLNESKKRYYEYFKIKDDVYFEYFKTLEWIAYYYFDNCADWLHIYPYENAPFVSDIYNYLQNNVITYCFPVSNDNYKSIKPIEQLLIVLPVQSGYLLPIQYKQLMVNELKDLYPKSFELEFILKKKFWQTTPKISEINYEKILNETKKIKLDAKYDKLNIFKKPFLNIFNKNI